MNTPELDALCEDLTEILRTDPKGTGVAPRLAAYVEQHRDWKPCAFFSDESYTRNLLHRCGEFELLLLCWNAGQESPIHCHDGQSCWMAVLEGELEEVHYRTCAEAAQGPLQVGRTKTFSAGGVAFIEDDIALHLIRPVAGGAGVSLHLYAGAIDKCRVFDPEAGDARLVELDYHSVRGELCDRSAAEVRAEWSAAR